MLSQKAEDTLTEFAAVKKADVQLQTQLGNRKGQIAANIIGAFAESQNSAFGWQVRAFGAENDTKGANAGIFFRRVDGESLYGINSFADYENGDYGEFLRYGIGGELQNRYVAFAANLYLPITDDKHTGSTVAFSQKGYDANLRISIPRLNFLKVAADYYHFDGKYGGEDDKGFRYGLELQPIANLRIGAFYDDGGEKFGGDIAYVYNIAPPQKRESAVAFSPDLFSPVLREYSQRIMTAQLGPQLRIITTAMTINTGTMITPQMVFTNTMTMAGMTTILTTETPTMTISRMASVQFTTRIESRGNYLVVTTKAKILATLPPATASRPYVLTLLMRDLQTDFSGELTAARVIDSNLRALIGNIEAFTGYGIIPWTITIVQGSEEFISVAITLITENTTTVPHIITETPTTIEMMTITTKLTTFATSTMTIGANIGAAKVDSHFPPSSPIMVSYGLAKNGDSWIPAMVVPAFAPFPRHSRVCVAGAGIQHTNAAACGGKGANAPLFLVIPAPAYARAGNGGNQLATGRRMLMAQSAI